jgi:dienelactone hydrolase
MMARLGALGGDPERTRVIARAGLEVLLAEPRADSSNVAVIGYCFGGTVALELARGGADLKAVVGFHPGLTTARSEDAANIKARVLVFVGSEDPFVPVDHRLAFEAEMRAGGVDWEMILFGGVEHSFTHPMARPERTGLPGIRFHPGAAERSWRAMLELFEDVFD